MTHAVEPPASRGPSVDWPVILAGTAVALATGLVLLTLGSAIGLTMMSLQPGEGTPPMWFTVVSGFWFLWAIMTAVGAGAYLAGRLTRPIRDAAAEQTELRDGAQGLVVWALSVVLGVMLAASGATGLVVAAAKATEAVAGETLGLLDQPLAVVASTLVRDPAGRTVPSDRLVGDAIRILAQMAHADGDLVAADRSYLVGRIASTTGEDPAQVEARLNVTMDAARKSWADSREALGRVRHAAIVTAFVVAATLLGAAVMGYCAAIAGGRERDNRQSLRSRRRVGREA